MVRQTTVAVIGDMGSDMAKAYPEPSSKPDLMYPPIAENDPRTSRSDKTAVSSGINKTKIACFLAPCAAESMRSKQKPATINAAIRALENANNGINPRKNKERLNRKVPGRR